MTEWERSHRDKGEGGQIEQRWARHGSREEGEFKLMLSVMIATEGAAGFWLQTIQRITELMGERLREGICVRASLRA